MKRIFFLLSLVICIMSITMFVKAENTRNNIIVIDAGHGGMDSGCVYNDIIEASINLSISKKLENVFILNGYDVVMTRADDSSLCEDKFVKKEDMNNRVGIINSSNALLCVSVHLNMFSDSKYSGAQVFYSEALANNKLLANSIQNSLKRILNNTDRVEIKRDNVYILNRSVIPTVIVECGFLSNDIERELLISDDYQIMLAYSIFYGCQKYLYSTN